MGGGHQTPSATLSSLVRPLEIAHLRDDECLAQSAASESTFSSSRRLSAGGSFGRAGTGKTLVAMEGARAGLMGEGRRLRLLQRWSGRIPSGVTRRLGCLLKPLERLPDERQ
jgi:hypothetical protein